MLVYERVIETSFLVTGLEGKISISNTGRFISASVDCQRFLPEGVQCKNNSPYIEVSKPTAAFIAEVFARVAKHEGYTNGR